jgi:hypothetical protein
VLLTVHSTEHDDEAGGPVVVVAGVNRRAGCGRGRAPEDVVVVGVASTDLVLARGSGGANSNAGEASWFGAGSSLSLLFCIIFLQQKQWMHFSQFSIYFSVSSEQTTNLTANYRFESLAISIMNDAWQRCVMIGLVS